MRIRLSNVRGGEPEHILFEFTGKWVGRDAVYQRMLGNISEIHEDGGTSTYIIHSKEKRVVEQETIVRGHKRVVIA